MGTELIQFSANDVYAQVQLIQQVMEKVMTDGEHYGLIPGCGTKKVLFKAGAEKLCFAFRYAPAYEVTQFDLPNGHREYRVICKMTHIQTGAFQGEGVGSCSTMETKYRWRNSERVCPACGGAFIIKGKADYGGGWLCFAKKGGCGEKYKDGDKAIEGQETGRKENEDIADQYNTVLKMAKKRALVDATITVSAASDIFTQDLEENISEPIKPAQPKADEQKAPEQNDATKWNDWALRQVRRAATVEDLEKVMVALKAKGPMCWTEQVRMEANLIVSKLEQTEKELAHAE